MDPVQTLHQHILACRRCQQEGYIERAAPVVAGTATNRLMLIGQAPGITELEVRRPFAGRAGKELFRWLASVGITEREFRAQVYMTAITKCYPGRATSGSGDRRPSPREMELCRPWLDQQLNLLRPAAILLVGGLAIDRFLPRDALVNTIGQRFELQGQVFIPLPHPSGASRWLNLPEHRELLRLALHLVRAEWDRVIEGCDASSAW